jgi:hypothetical protein
MQPSGKRQINPTKSLLSCFARQLDAVVRFSRIASTTRRTPPPVPLLVASGTPLAPRPTKRGGTHL